jgi:hypothetical protein
MNLINDDNSSFLALAAHEKFFVESWHGMTHELSLDSHRVRCLNTRAILRELNLELRSGRLAVEDLTDLCEEASEIISLDPLAAAAYPRHHRLLLPFLQKPPQIPDEKKKEAEVDRVFREFKFTVADFSAELERDYLKRLLEALPDAIVSGDDNRCHATIGALLSDLVDQGWPLESLFGWVDLFFQKKRPPYDTFNSNLLFLIRHLDWGKQAFRVVLRLSGSSKLSSLGDFEGFNFKPAPGFIAKTPSQMKFSGQHPQSAFAETAVQAVDFNSAAIGARENFEQCLDRMRFNFEPSPLRIDDRSYVERSGDKRVELVVVRHLVPNPTHHLAANAFREFSDEINAVLSRPAIEKESCERLRAAIRHYRFGRDADSYKDKFLNWWMGLEFLTYVTDGNIGRTVGRFASDALLQRYLYRILNDLLRTMQEHQVSWAPDLAAHCGCAKLSDLKLPELIKALQSRPHAEALALAFGNHPVAAFRIHRLAEKLQDPKKTAEFLQTHHRHVFWQMARLYRIRCCIVHGSPLHFKFPLLTANLEFYLKEIIIVCQASLGQFPHVCSLREVFQRAGVMRERVRKELEASGATLESVHNAVFSSIVTLENT